MKDHYHIDLDNKTSEQELDWYYFQMHDFDNNLVLDGLEILTAMNHVIDENTLKSRESVTTNLPPVSIFLNLTHLPKKSDTRFCMTSKLLEIFKICKSI